MKKIFYFVIVAVLLLSACTPAVAPTAAPEQPAATEQPTDNSMEGVPSIFAEKTLKIAVIRNLPSDDHTKQFLDGARTEGESFGFVVDTFIADNDDAKFQELVAPPKFIVPRHKGEISTPERPSFLYSIVHILF